MRCGAFYFCGMTLGWYFEFFQFTHNEALSFRAVREILIGFIFYLIRLKAVSIERRKIFRPYGLASNI